MSSCTSCTTLAARAKCTYNSTCPRRKELFCDPVLRWKKIALKMKPHPCTWLCLTCSWKLSLLRRFSGLKTAARDATQRISRMASKILLQLFEILGLSGNHKKNCAHLPNYQKPFIFFPFLELRKAFISAVQWMR